MDLKKILKELEKIDEENERIKYLEKALKKTKDKELKKEIREIIEKEKESLESKIDEKTKETPTVNLRREFLEETEEPKYQPRAGATLEQDLGEITPIQEGPSEGYSSGGYGVNIASYDTTFDSDFNNVAEIAREKILLEGDLSESSFSTDLGRDTLGKKIKEMSPGISKEEEIMYLQHGTSLKTKKDKDKKYISIGERNG